MSKKTDHDMNNGPAALPLSNHCLYDGNDVDDAREVLSKLFTEIALEPLDPGQPFRAQVNGVELPRIAVCYLRFENGAVAGPIQPLDFHTLQLNLDGSSVYNTDDGATGGDDRHGVMLSAGQTVRNRHSVANGHLALIVKDEVIRKQLAQYTGKAKTTALKFNAEVDLTQTRTASFLSFVDTFTQELNRPGGILEAPAAIASFEDFLITSLLSGLEHNHIDALDARTPSTAPQHVRRVEEYISAHACEPLTMAEIAEVSGVSGTTMNRAFRRYRGCTPMQFLLDERMRLVHERLLFGGPTDTVQQIAMACGFVHMGRFAAEYRRRFNERPSETLMRAKTRIDQQEARTKDQAGRPELRSSLLRPVI